jgi:hypothetical protein
MLLYIPVVDDISIEHARNVWPIDVVDVELASRDVRDELSGMLLEGLERRLA